MSNTIKPELLLKISSLAGKILLESGAEIQRTEETICRICESYGAEEVSAFVIPTGMFLSFSSNGKTISKIQRIHGSSLNIEKINLVNDLSRKCHIAPMEPHLLYATLCRVQNIQVYTNKTLLLSGGVIASCFTLFFGGNFKDAFFALFIGAITQFLVQKFDLHKINFMVKTVCSSVILTILALCLQRLHLIENLDSIIIGTLMLLVPGLAITNAVRDSIGGDLLAGIIRAIEALLIAVAIALGAGITMSIWLSIMGGIS